MKRWCIAAAIAGQTILASGAVAQQDGETAKTETFDPGVQGTEVAVWKVGGRKLPKRKIKRLNAALSSGLESLGNVAVFKPTRASKRRLRRLEKKERCRKVSLECAIKVGQALEVTHVVAGVASGDKPLSLEIWLVDIRSSNRTGQVTGQVSPKTLEEDVATIVAQISSAFDQQVASLSIASNVDGAKVALDGHIVATTPTAEAIRDLAPGTYEITVSAEGHTPFVETVVLEEGSQISINANLVATAPETPESAAETPHEEATSETAFAPEAAETVMVSSSVEMPDAAPAQPEPEPTNPTSSTLVTAAPALQQEAPAAAKVSSISGRNIAFSPVEEIPPTSYFLAALARGTTATGNLGMMAGFQAGAVFQGRYLVGIGGAMTVYEPEINGTRTRNRRYLSMGYGGPQLALRLLRHDFASLDLGALIGFGGAAHYSGHDNDTRSDIDFFWLLEPGVAASVYLSETLCVGLGVSYRLAFDVDLENVLPSDSAWLEAPAGVNIDLALKLVF